MVIVTIVVTTVTATVMVKKAESRGWAFLSRVREIHVFERCTAAKETLRGQARER